ncbi:MAG: hypothetical protein ACOYD0_02390 [Candidatus Nanopelagicales bacterium]
MSAADAARGARAKPAKQYGWSAFATACARFWRATLLFAAVAGVNAAIQALLTVPKPVPGLNNAEFLLLALASYLVLLVSLAAISTAALRTVSGRAGFADTWNAMRPRLGHFILWTFLWTVACTVGFMLFAVPGIILLLLTPYMVIAAADGTGNPLTANFRAIGSRFGRYLITVITSCVWLVLLYVTSGVTSFILDGANAAFAFWLIAGVSGAWMVTTWALIYRSTPVGSVTEFAHPTRQSNA